MLRAAMFGVIAAASVVVSADGPFASLKLASNRTSYSGKCPVTVIFTGNINYAMPHPQGFVYNYHWGRSDGATTQPTVVTPPAKAQMLIVKESWEIGKSGDYTETLFADNGNTHMKETSAPKVHIVCK
jgi:hypothetical protein